MKRFLLVLLLALAACREDEAARPSPVALTAETAGHFCQMTLLEHPGPKAQVHFEEHPGQPFFFSQVSDAVAYRRMPEQDGTIVAIYVSDMGAAASWEAPGAGNWIDAESATYVVGSSRLGGMGAPELVPFADAVKAADFAAAYGGTLHSFADIPDSAIPGAVQTVAEPGTAADNADYLDRLKKLDQRPGG